MKICTKCLKELPFTSFYKNSRSRNGYAHYCKCCASEQVKKSRNLQEHLQKVYARRDRCRAYVLDYLSTHPCVDCGESNPVVLEFDHISGIKVESISKMVSISYSLDNIQAEINKCQVRCANCHRIVTSQRNKNHWIHKKSLPPELGD